MIRKRIIASTIILIVVALLSISAISYAWLTRNRELESQGQTMQIEAQGVLAETYSVYRYNNEENYIDEITTDTNIYEMEPYDSIFTERNVNTPLLYEITLKNVPKASETNITVSLECSESSWSKVEDDAGYTSNIVYSECASINTINAWATSHGKTPLSLGWSTQGDKDSKFDTAVSYFRAEGTETTFVTGTAPSFTKRTTMDYPITVSGDENGKAVVYLIIDYDKDLVEAQGIFGFNSIDISAQTIDLFRSMIPFENDIIRISFN